MKIKNKLIAFLIILIIGLFFACQSNAVTIYRKTLLTGNTTASMDYINGSLLSDGDECRVFLAGNIFYWYLLDADSGLTESSPDVISPDTNPGSKRWVLQNINYDGIDLESLTLDGAKNLTTLANINDIFVYDTSKDPDGGAWRNDERAKASSWYNETLNDSDRGSRREFPEKAILVVTNDYLYIYDAKDNTMWMRFDDASSNIIRPDTGIVSSVYGLNGTVYAGCTAGYSLRAVNFKKDTALYFTTADNDFYKGDISDRNSGSGWYNGLSGLAIINETINDIHAQIINGKEYVAVATDGGISIINFTDQTVVDVYQSGLAYTNHVWLTSKGELYFAYGSVSGSTCEVLNAYYTLPTSDLSTYSSKGTYYYYAPSLYPRLYGSYSSYISGLSVIENASKIDGTSNTLVIGRVHGGSIIEECQSDKTNGAVKHVNHYFISELMVGDIRGMWGFYEAASGNPVNGDKIDDHSQYSDTYDFDMVSVQGATAVSGVRGKGLTLNGSTQYLKQYVHHDESNTNASYDPNNTVLTDASATFTIIDTDTDLETSYQTASGNSTYYIEVTDPNSLIMWGYIRNIDPNTTNTYKLAIYNDLAGSNQNWNGSEASMDANSVMTWDIRKTQAQGTWSTGLTCGAWVKDPDVSDGIMAKWKETADQAFLLYMTSDGYAIFTVRNSTTSYSATGATDISDDAWHFVVGVFNPSTAVKIYVDGICVSTNTTSIPATLNDVYTTFAIGCNFNASYEPDGEWNGEIDEPFISAEVYGPDVIKAMYESGKRALENHTASRVTGMTGADTYQQLQGNKDYIKAVAVDDGHHYMYLGVDDTSTNTGSLTVIGLDSDSVVDLYSSTNTGMDDSNSVQFDINDIVAVSVSGTPNHQYNSGDTEADISWTLAIAGTNDSTTKWWGQCGDINLYSILSQVGGADLSKQKITIGQSITILPGENLRDSTTGEMKYTPAFHATEEGNLKISGSATLPTMNYAADAGSTDAYAITLTPALLSYTTGMVVFFYANTVNTGACTLNINSLGAKSLKMLHDQDPPDSFIEAGSIMTVVYDGTNFQIVGPGDCNP